MLINQRYNIKRKLLIRSTLILSILIGFNLNAEESDTFLKELTLPVLLQRVIERGPIAQIQQLEILKSDTALKKESSAYTPKIAAGYEGKSTKSPDIPATMLQGTREFTDSYFLSFSKQFRTGTSFAIQGYDSRIDNNLGERDQDKGTLIEAFASPPLHVSGIQVSLGQELLRNYFGFQGKLSEQIAKNESERKRNQLEYELAQILVSAMNQYWQFSLAQEQKKAAEALLQNATQIKNLTIQKAGLGLAEYYEVSQWSALEQTARIDLENATVQSEDQRLALLRLLDLPTETNISLDGKSGIPLLLNENLPNDLNLENDIELALKRRPDLRNLELQLSSAKTALKLAEGQLLPSLAVQGTYDSRNYGRHAALSPDATSGIYPESSIRVQLEVPLWDEGALADRRDANLSIQQMEILQADSIRQAKDEIQIACNQLLAAHRSMSRMKEALKHAERMYAGIVFDYRSGRMQAESVKSALDAVIQARLGMAQTKTSFNVMLARYDLLCYRLFEKNGIDLEAALKKGDRQ
ncbi:MAG: TolC family protein [Leptonema sp. (in: Bacteria)]|nr:TolC family protein [Leptonema sp. (in: bacteria)]